MTVLSFLILVLLAAVCVWAINTFVADTTIKRVLILLLAVLIILYVLSGSDLGGVLNRKL